jgi:divalent metal cation (Fe/Co/Zn/Cd) transporter
VLKGAYDIFMDSNTELMDGVDDPMVYHKIFEAVAEVKGVSNPHRVRSRQISHMHMIQIDIEVDGRMTLEEAHSLSHLVEEKIRDKVENIYDIVIHIEPLGNIEVGEKDGVENKIKK